MPARPERGPRLAARPLGPALGLALLVLGQGCGDSSGVDGSGPGPVVRVAVAPADGQLEAGGTLQFTAQALDADDQPVAGVVLRWGTSDSSIATVTGTGLVTGVAAGVVTVSAATGGREGTAMATVTDAPPPPVILLAAGDIASCDSLYDEATAALLDALPGSIAVLGDNAYPNGALADYTGCYDPSWGRHKARTHPSPGNHEYQTAGAAGYWSYWGAAAGTAGEGWYSYDLGTWHIVALNSNCAEVGCGAGSAQEQWLRADLAAHPAQCTLAYWHHPRFSSGASHGNNTSVQPLWQALHDAGADLVLNGHEHLYERFAPQTATGMADPATGIRQFTVGTGGRMLVPVGTVKPNSQVINNDTYGVLELTLGAGSYAWRFIPALGAPFTDAGQGACH